MTERSYPPLRPQAGAPRRRATPWALVIGVVLLAILATVLAVVLLTRDGGGGTGIGSPSATPSASTGSGTPVASPSAGSPDASASASASTPAASAGPTPVVAAPDGIVPVGSVVEISADGLRIREEPSTSSAVLETVPAGESLYLVSNPNVLGPIVAEGYDWYLVMHASGWNGWPENPPGYDGPSGDPRVSGWVAAGSATDSFVELEPVTCPTGAVDIHTIYAMTAWARLSCFGDRQLTFEGTYGCGGCGGISPGTFSPEWLAHPINFAFLQPPYAEGNSSAATLVLHDPPDGAGMDEVEAGSVLRVTGHFNDPRAAECVIAPGEPGDEQPADETAAEWYCREQFVVESWEVLGTDPDFTSS